MLLANSEVLNTCLLLDGYADAIEDYVPVLSGRALDKSLEPFKSTETLRQRRNETVHKSSGLVTPVMARAAFYSAVAGSQALYGHFGQPFKYTPFLMERSLPVEPWFSQVSFPLVVE